MLRVARRSSASTEVLGRQWQTLRRIARCWARPPKAQGEEATTERWARTLMLTKTTVPAANGPQAAPQNCARARLTAAESKAIAESRLTETPRGSRLQGTGCSQRRLRRDKTASRRPSRTPFRNTPSGWALSPSWAYRQQRHWRRHSFIRVRRDITHHSPNF